MTDICFVNRLLMFFIVNLSNCKYSSNHSKKLNGNFHCHTHPNVMEFLMPRLTFSLKIWYSE